MKKLSIECDVWDPKAEDIVTKHVTKYFRFNLGVAKTFKENEGIDLLSSKNDIESNMTTLATTLPAYLWVKIVDNKLVQNASTADEAKQSDWYEGLTMNQTIELIKLIQPDDEGGRKGKKSNK